MSLPDDYRRQFVWRSWSAILDELPPLAGQVVVDLGCGIGDQAALLASRGARVIAIDANDELLAVARARRLADAEFLKADLHRVPDVGQEADGLWSSFAAAYFPDLAGTLASWRRLLRPGGWVALTEVDDLFGHAPLREETAQLLTAYAADALRAGRYDFFMGRKLANHLRLAGFRVSRVFEVPDRELAFQGPATPAIVAAWRARVDRMRLLHDFCGAESQRVRDDFLQCLARDDHQSLAKVVCCIAVDTDRGGRQAREGFR